jgi:hypothetical protein
MTKKRLLLLASLPLTIALTLGVLVMLPPRPGVTKANFERIRKGMTVEEVKEVFGETHFRIGPAWGKNTWVSFWSDSKRSAAVCFDDDGCVIETQWRLIASETFLEKLRRWLHLD